MILELGLIGQQGALVGEITYTKARRREAALLVFGSGHQLVLWEHNRGCWEQWETEQNTTPAPGLHPEPFSEVEEKRPPRRTSSILLAMMPSFTQPGSWT